MHRHVLCLRPAALSALHLPFGFRDRFVNRRVVWVLSPIAQALDGQPPRC
jgi:hypothetical protein